MEPSFGWYNPSTYWRAGLNLAVNIVEQNGIQLPYLAYVLLQFFLKKTRTGILMITDHTN